MNMKKKPFKEAVTKVRTKHPFGLGSMETPADLNKGAVSVLAGTMHHCGLDSKEMRKPRQHERPTP